jgi:2-polyprenyl-3-methyl-5-hydroxy-6-metoxy-1,4-benzoquinol methylase
MSSPTAATTKPAKRLSPAVTSYRGTKLELPAHTDAPDPDDRAAIRRWVRAQVTSGLTALDLFCGAGGLSLGLEKAGFRVLVGADLDAPAVSSPYWLAAGRQRAKAMAARQLRLSLTRASTGAS